MAFNLVQRRFVSTALKKWAYNLSGFNKYGLMRDDMRIEDEVVTEALRRCPQNLVDERNFRVLRAMQLSICNDILPKEQWTKFEDDVLYLTPYVKEIEKEIEERQQWDKNH